MAVLRLLFVIALARWPWLLLGLGCAVVALLANVALLSLAAWFLASMALAGVQGQVFNYFLPAAGIRLLAILRSLGRYAERLFAHDATLRLLADLRVHFFKRLAPLVPGGLPDMHSAELLSRLRADIDTLDHFYLRMLLPALAAMAVMLVGYLFLSAYDRGMALTVLGLWLAAGLLLPLLTLLLGQSAGKRQTETAARLRRRVADSLQGLEELRVYGAVRSQRERVAHLNRTLLHSQGTQARLDSFAQGAVGLAAGLAAWAVLLFGIPRLAVASWSGAALPMLTLFALASFEAMQPLPGAWRMWGQIRTAAERILQVTGATPPVPDPAIPAAPPQGADLRIRQLRFTYPGAAGPVFDGLDLELPALSRTALVGPAGAGKSTLLHLLLRFWDCQAGEILLDGRPLGHYTGEQVRGRMAVVSQHVYLFNATIAENLRLADPDADDAALMEAARIARIDTFIRSLPAGLDTPVGPLGTRLSGGQARRLAVARALLKNAPVLILDEPTEGLDHSTEEALWETLAPVMRDRTVLLITHRPAGLEYMERIVELKPKRL
ncbi:thiol reductant ABC exporter subunit CydC [Desulfatitalea alkaliphila]|uniref:Thiol reductant ABC exporter subunit CydC n=1 Tax=Desulfatitalea alkaliphila TaxID=2929485 RepID=A0AA41UL75_9BACT|nr:thiol reductant ABC exporter subunit CydC [Desulfatitalea alkaliphila]MCJ8501181.1 thiol reductant ABC exporter subunit CydC [Desulfatitalea alkaliphila]